MKFVKIFVSLLVSALLAFHEVSDELIIRQHKAEAAQDLLAEPKVSFSKGDPTIDYQKVATN